MKVLFGLEELKYMALYCVAMYNKTHHASYRHSLERVVEQAMKFYGLAGLTEVLDFMRKQSK